MHICAWTVLLTYEKSFPVVEWKHVYINPDGTIINVRRIKKNGETNLVIRIEQNSLVILNV